MKSAAPPDLPFAATAKRSAATMRNSMPAAIPTSKAAGPSRCEATIPVTVCTTVETSSTEFDARSCAGVIAAAEYASDTPFTARSGRSSANAPNVDVASGAAAQCAPYTTRRTRNAYDGPTQAQNKPTCQGASEFAARMYSARTWLTMRNVTHQQQRAKQGAQRL